MSWSVKAGIAVVVTLGVLLWLLGPILMPFAASAGLAYLGDPVVDRLQRYKLSRTFAVILVFTAMLLLILPALVVLVPLLVDQVRIFVSHVPDYLDWIQNKGLPALGIYLPAELRLEPENLKRMAAENLPQAGGMAKAALSIVTKGTGAVLAIVAGLLLIPVVTFYLLRDWDHLVHWVDENLPRRYQPTVRTLARESDTVLGGFLRGQLLVMLALAIVYCVGLSVIGLNLALLIGIGAGLVSFVPYLGFIAGLFAAGIAAVVQFDGLQPLLWVFLIFMLGQVLESMLLTPWLVGDRIGMHPVAVIFAVMAGGQLFGVVGVLVGLPAAAVIAVLLRHALARWRESPAFHEP